MNKKFAIKINKISKSFDEKVVLENVSFSLYFGQKVALIGVNGSGKSTLAKIIMGNFLPNSGSIEIFKNFSVSYLPQEFTENLLVEKYLKISDTNKSQILKVLSEFSFGEEILRRRISELSGGEKTKIFLAKITLEKSEIIILDEPTNNLDTEGIEYLEKVIKNSNSAFLIISHDRNFMDKTVSKILFLDEDSKNISAYDGGYSDFLEKRKIERAKQEMDYVENQRQKGKITKEILNQKGKTQRGANTLKFATDNLRSAVKDRFNDAQNSAGRNLKKAQTKLDNFTDLENIKIKRPLKIDFSDMKSSGHDVLKISDLKLKYGNSEKINSEIVVGDRVHILGKNGTGKTTLIKELLKNYKFSFIHSIECMNENDSIKWGVNVELGYLPQTLDYGKNDETFLEYFLDKTGKNVTDSRKILNRFGFGDEEVANKVLELSPGMRGRGKIALMLANNPNVLILDEPTNNLDLEVLEKLEIALHDYRGTIIFVSHDKYFVEKMKANKNISL